MVRPRHRGNRLLHLPKISADPRARACGYSGSNPASALRSSPSFASSSSCCAAIIYLSPMFVIPLRVPFLSPTCESSYCASFIYSSPSCVTRLFVLRVVHLSVPYVRHSLARPLSISYSCVMSCASFTCLSCVSFCLVVTAGAEGRKGCQTRWRAGRIKGWAR
jgi:hypothetical protein